MSHGSLLSNEDNDVVIVERNDVSNYNPDNILPESPETIARIRQWLQPTEYSVDGGEYRKHLTAHLENTGEWVLRSDEYQKWHDSPDHGLLWIKGVPGSGKSVLAAALAHKLSQEGVPVLFFFFRQIVDANHQPINLLRDWLDQILLYSPPLQSTLKDYVDSSQSLDSVSIDELWQHLRTALASIPLTYCVVDALDEMDQGNDDFLLSLADLGHWRPSIVKVLMTSRPVVGVEAPMRGVSCVSIRMDERFIDVDISTYVQHCLDRTSLSEADRKLIKEAVPGRANGLFLYAKLAMKAFLEPNANISDTLHKLPLDLDDMYIGILQEHAARSGISEMTQVLILQWVTHATRPLRLLELADLLKTTVEDRRPFSVKDNKDLVRAACGPLLEILPDETVSVVHHSLTEFLVESSRSERSAGYPVLEPKSTHHQFAIACLTYLFRRTDGDVESDSPFVAYASNNWFEHASRASWAALPEDPLSQQVEKFLSDRETRKIFLRCILPRGIFFEELISSFSDLHVAAFCGLDNYVPILIDRLATSTVDIHDHSQQTPLWWAARRGHAGVVRALLRAGAVPNPPNTYGSRALDEAARHGHSEVIKLLIDEGVYPLSAQRIGPTHVIRPRRSLLSANPVQLACQYGQLKSLEAFLPYLDRHAKNLALHWTAHGRHSHIMKRLLQEPDVDPNIRVDDMTPLFIVAGEENLDSMEALVDAGADASIRCEVPIVSEDTFRESSGTQSQPRLLLSTALSMFCLQHAPGPRYVRTASISDEHRPPSRPDDFPRGLAVLIRAGANVNETDSLGRAPIHVTQSPAAIKHLLDAGADPNAETPDGKTALHSLSEDADENYLKLLVEEGGADINKREHQEGKTPLLAALFNDSKLVDHILKYGPDCKTVDIRGNGPLHHACAIGNRSSQGFNTVHNSQRDNGRLLHLLLALMEAGADPKLANCDGETPLHVLGRRMRLKDTGAIQLLLKFGASIDARDFKGRTPLFRLVGSQPLLDGVCDLIDSFREASASLDVRDNEGRTLLHEAIRSAGRQYRQGQSLSQVYRKLIDAGLSPCALDYKGNTLCHELVMARGCSRDPDVALVFLSLFEQIGLDTDQPNLSGTSPLHLASQMCLDGQECDEHARQCFEWLLDHSSDPNAVDRYGLRPIHFAASTFEYTVDRLLRAGADPFVSTSQGMNVLHIASRCRRSNILGQLLERMKELDPLALTKALNQKNMRQLTPLHYASRSGRIESVLLLLESGADVNPTFDPSPLNNEPWYPPVLQCVFFKQEHELWRRGYSQELPIDTFHDTTLFGPGEVRYGNGLLAAGFTIEDTTRRSEERVREYRSDIFNPVHDIIRYDDIVRVLLTAGANMYDNTHWEDSAFCSAMRFAAREWDDYTTNLLWNCHKEIGGPELLTPMKVSVTMSMARRQSDTKLLGETVLLHPEYTAWETIEHLLGDREYSLIAELYKARADFISVNAEGTSILRRFIELGFANLVDDCCSAEEVSRFDDAEWRSQQWQPQNFAIELVEPLVLVACRRPAPNMEVLRILVEKKGASVNPAKDRRTQPLHLLAAGDHWWQVAQAIPYLISKGADLEARDRAGCTPLLAAIEEGGWMCAAVVKSLLALGANVHAVDSQGKGCLDYATFDEELVRLLIRHGAEVSPTVLSYAAKGRNPGVLKALLSAGEASGLARSLNLRLEDVDGLKATSLKARMASLGHPLFLASEPGWRWVSFTESREENERVEKEMMITLLAAGASVYDTFTTVEPRRRRGVPIRYAVNDGEATPFLPAEAAEMKWNTDGTSREIVFCAEDGEDSGDKDSNAGSFCSSSIDRKPKTMFQITVLHEILRKSGMLEPILGLPDLNVEYRDESGQTPLLAACRRAPRPEVCTERRITPPLRLLLERGADPTAVDKHGRNALHHKLGSPCSNDLKLEALRVFDNAVPALVNKPDTFGYYPIHYGLASFVSDGTPETDPEWLDYIISKGADVTATDADGNNALHYLISGVLKPTGSCSRNHGSVLKQFVEFGLDINARNNAGQTPVFFLTSQWDMQPRSDDDLSLLDNLGVDWRARDDTGSTLLHDMGYASAHCFKAIMDRGVDPLLEDIDGRSSLDNVAACGNKEVLALFERKN
ncbi:hypothetical protein FDECE_875 [Fusarium decemcellulare]|nr:hypothetical protein FDECE_875 [Fusarium decemcellulare]